MQERITVAGDIGAKTSCSRIEIQNWQKKSGRTEKCKITGCLFARKGING